MSYRSDWFKQHNLEYFPPKLDNLDKWQCIGKDMDKTYQQMVSGEWGPRMRQPGEDDE